jgi:CheY-like chemotaxis protein
MSASPHNPVDILLVGDRPCNLLALAAVLNQPGYHCIRASSGEEALKLVLERRFAVILLDVIMPGEDGLEVASLLKARGPSTTTPTIFLTGLGADLDACCRLLAGSGRLPPLPIKPVARARSRSSISTA